VRKSAETLKPEVTKDEASYLLEICRRMGFPGKHLEIGTAAGGTLCLLMKVFEDETRPPFVVVDRMTYFPDQLNIIKTNLKNNGLSEHGVDFRIKTSVEAFNEAYSNKEIFDFILIDAGHKIHRVMEDLRWTRLLNAGGVICMHDYGPSKGVKLAADRFMKKNTHFELLGLVDSLLVLRKNHIAGKEEVTMADRLWSVILAPVLQLESSIKKRLRKKGWL